MNYDALYILDLKGKDEGFQEALDQVEKTISAQGGKVINTQKMDKRRFERVAGSVDAGFYVNVQIEIEPGKVPGLEAELKRDELVYRQFYLKKPLAAAKAGA